MSSRNKGICFIILSAFSFALMGACVRLAGDVPSIQKSFFRNLVAMIFALIILLRSGEKLSYQKKDLPMLFLRSVFGTMGILCNFYAVDHLVVSDASMLNKLSPFFVIIFSSLFLKEKANRVQKISVVIAFIGALFVIRPSVDIFQNVNSLVGVLGGLGAGIAYTCVRQLGKQGVKGARVVFFFSAFSCLVLVPFLILDYHPMSLKQILFLLGAGLMAAGGQFTITAAYNFAPAKEISVFDYTQVVFAALLGFFVLGQVPDLYSVIGYVIIIGVAVWSFLRSKVDSHAE